LPRLGSRVRIPSPAPLSEPLINGLAGGGCRESSSAGALKARYPFGGCSAPPQRKALACASGRGGLHPSLGNNNSARAGTVKLPGESLCFPPRVSHQAGAPPPNNETAAPVTSRGSGTRQSNPNSQIYPALSSPDKATLAPATAIRPSALDVSTARGPGGGLPDQAFRHRNLDLCRPSRYSRAVRHPQEHGGVRCFVILRITSRQNRR
jgi:hypothetical protein